MQTEEEAESTQVEVSPIVKPVVSLQELQKNHEEFEKIKKLLLKPDDYYKIKIGNKEVDALGKAGWYKLGVAFNLTTTIIAENRTFDPESKTLKYDTTVRCTAPNGRYADEVGTCDNGPLDRQGMNEHVIRAMAKTRATERAYIVVLGVSEKAADDLESAGERVSEPQGEGLADKDGEYRKGVTCNCEEKQMRPQTKPDKTCHRCGGNVA